MIPKKFDCLKCREEVIFFSNFHRLFSLIFAMDWCVYVIFRSRPIPILSIRCWYEGSQAFWPTPLDLSNTIGACPPSQFFPSPSSSLSAIRSVVQPIFPPFRGLVVGLGREVRSVYGADFPSTSTLSDLLWYRPGRFFLLTAAAVVLSGGWFIAIRSRGGEEQQPMPSQLFLPPLSRAASPLPQSAFNSDREASPSPLSLHMHFSHCRRC